MKENGRSSGIMIALVVIGILLVGNIVLTVVFRAERNIEIDTLEYRVDEKLQYIEGSTETLRKQVDHLFDQLGLEPPGEGPSTQPTAETISKWREIQRKRRCMENIRRLGKAIGAYRLENEDWLPNLVDMPIDFSETQPTTAPVKKTAEDPQP